jgi:hypothetical protein
MTTTTTATLPVSCDVALKEWAGVCEALARGEQIVILRKGGIAEEEGRFRVEHHAFWLFPTAVHQVEQGLKSSQPQLWVEPAETESVALNLFATVAHVCRAGCLDHLEALANYHVLTPETVEKRFHYREPGLWVLIARVFRRRTPDLVPISPEQAGCKSWVSLGRSLSIQGLEPALTDSEFLQRAQAVRDVLEPSSSI